MVGLYFFFFKSRIEQIQNLPLVLSIQYFVALFSAQPSRDATFTSFIILGIGLILYSTENMKYRKISLIFGILFLILALMFRPQLGAGIYLFVLFLFYSKHLQFKMSLNMLFQGSIAILLILLPPIAEIKLSQFFVSKSSFPAQTFLIHDLGFAACNSSNPATSNKAINTLQEISVDINFAQRYCQFYRANTWQSVIANDGLTLVKGDLKPPIRVANSSQEFKAIRDGWLEILSSDPKTYLQGKLVFLGEFLFSPQGRVSFDKLDTTFVEQNSTASYAVSKFFQLLTLPWTISSNFYLLSPGPFMLLLLFVTVKSRHEISLNLKPFILLLLMLGAALTISTVSYVSDNARYFTPFLILASLGFYHLKRTSRGKQL